ncbi:MAG: hypothetical protein ABH885_02535 [Candidatus Omnitrophota bacterium]
MTLNGCDNVMLVRKKMERVGIPVFVRAFTPEKKHFANLCLIRHEIGMGRCIGFDQ